MDKYVNELKHYGRKGMKWYQNVYGKNANNSFTKSDINLEAYVPTASNTSYVATSPTYHSKAQLQKLLEKTDKERRERVSSYDPSAPNNSDFHATLDAYEKKYRHSVYDKPSLKTKTEVDDKIAGFKFGTDCTVIGPYTKKLGEYAEKHGQYADLQDEKEGRISVGSRLTVEPKNNRAYVVSNKELANACYAALKLGMKGKKNG